MIYEGNIKQGVFLSRPNRFIAHVLIDGEPQVCHVKNTGRCKELLLEGVMVYVQQHDNPKRKTAYSLIAVQKGERLVNIDSQAPNRAFYEWALKGGFADDFIRIKPEEKYANSRFDFYIETGQEKLFVEVKGVTLEQDGVVSFPDAPTERGIKHMKELCACIQEGFGAAVVFVVQMKGVRYFTPNLSTHPEFAKALRDAYACGVQVYALDCAVAPNGMEIKDVVEVRLWDDLAEGKV